MPQRQAWVLRRHEPAKFDEGKARRGGLVLTKPIDNPADLSALRQLALI